MVSLGALASKIFGSANERRLKAYRQRIDAINALEEELARLSDDELRQRTDLFRAQVADGTTLNALLVPAFATVREAAKRSIGQRHFDVQLIGGMVLHEGGIAEMKTGEGKTLVATLAVYLNALTQKGVHVVTVNDYLATRDAEWMGSVYHALGLTTGVIVHGKDDAERRRAYACDVTYGTNNELGFDYLRDNMKHELGAMVQRGHAFAIVDEVDSILIDEARTPLIISGAVEDRSELYSGVDGLIGELTDDDFEIDEKQRAATLTEAGNEHIERLARAAGLLREGTLYDIENVTLVHHVNQALKAHKLFQRDRDYIVRGGDVVIIDEFTGRMMPGRRYSEGLHQALEAKEKAIIQPENQTLASITFQNYFRMYNKLSGMTGTAVTEANEFSDIYRLEVIEIPTNRPIRRQDEDDEVYRTFDEKYAAITDQIEACRSRGQPVLVGTTSIEKSELLAQLLVKQGYRQKDFSDKDAFSALYSEDTVASDSGQDKVFAVLNARYHEQEAFIIAQAGVPGAVTIATNMAGRGTDIQLGGNADMRIRNETDALQGPEEKAQRVAAIHAEIETLKARALAAGGLYIIGTERHESRRIDNQLRGRSGRQGDPGHSKFYLSLQDDLMRIFGSDRMDSMLVKLGLQEGEAIVHPWINRALEKAQQKVEARNFDARKNVLKYDDVMNDQRRVVFEQRIELMDSEHVGDIVADMRHDVVENLVEQHIPENAYAEQWDISGLESRIEQLFGLKAPVADWAEEEGIAEAEIAQRLKRLLDEAAASKAANLNPDLMRQIEKSAVLQTLDRLWRDHLLMLEHLRQVVGLRGYGQRDPLNEYKTEAFSLFETLLEQLREEVTAALFHFQLVEQPMPAMDPDLPEMHAIHTDPLTGENELETADLALAATAGLPGSAPGQPSPRRQQPASAGPRKIGRNQPCPCGSGKKYKHCHGALT